MKRRKAVERERRKLTEEVGVELEAWKLMRIQVRMILAEEGGERSVSYGGRMDE